MVPSRTRCRQSCLSRLCCNAVNSANHPYGLFKRRDLDFAAACQPFLLVGLPCTTMAHFAVGSLTHRAGSWRQPVRMTHVMTRTGGVMVARMMTRMSS